jgi:hypothetical protein
VADEATHARALRAPEHRFDLSLLITTRGICRRSEETERAGFEPAMEREPHTRLAGECLQPLGHLSLGSPASVKGGRGRAWCSPGLASAPSPEGWQSGRMHQS